MPQCAFHPDIETEVSCTECGRYICQKDMVPTPVGYKCPICAKPAKGQYTYVKPRQWALAVLFGAVVGVGGALLMTFFAGGFFGLLIGYFWGVLTAEAARRGSGGHRGKEMAALAVGMIWLGWLVAIPLGGLGFITALAATFGAASTLAWSWNS